MHNFKFVSIILLINTILFANVDNIVLNNQENQTIDKIDHKEISVPEKSFEEKAQANVKESLSRKDLTLFFTNKRVLKRYYKNFDYKLFWVNEEGIKDIALELLETIKTDPVLKPNSKKAFKLEKIVEVLNSLDKSPDKYIQSMTRIDFMLTEVYDRYMKYLSKGFINWKAFQTYLKEMDKKDEIIADWEKYNVKKNMSNLLIQAIEANNLSIAFNEVDYTFPKVKELSVAINDLELIAQNGGYTKLPKSKTLRKGDKAEIIKVLRKRLLESRDLKQTCKDEIITADNIVTNSIETSKDLNIEKESETKIITNGSETISVQNSCEEIFDEELKQAVISFQKNHGLDTDGVVGASTIKHLNIPIESKINKIRLNLERMRWLPRNLGEKYLMVNIPDYRLKMYENGEMKLTMEVVVGERRHPTPVFSNKMSFIVLNPYWRIPPRIVEREIIPKILANPNYLEGKGINIHDSWDQTSEPLALNSIDWNMYNPENLDYKDIAEQLPTIRLIQEPSEKNPLGRIKFMFPNKYSVYMHDTPAKSLFKKTYRAFSHGCIRLARPKDLLKEIANEDKNLDYEKATEILKEIEKTTVGLTKKIPVHIVYLTAWIDDEGKLQFRDDIYNYDKIQKKLLF